jgi:heme/copper-type cytochrome/quinol oxidase subunit 4
MKMLFTILFFADTILLVTLTYRFLKMMDSGEHGWQLLALLTAIAGSIGLLAFFLYRYTKLPPRKS